MILISAAQADTSWKKQVSSFKPGPYKAITPVQLTYDISWNGLFRAGKATIIFGKPDERYNKKGIFVSQLYGQAGTNIVPFGFSMTSFTKDKTFNPILCNSTETDKKEKLIVTNYYKKTGVESTSKTVLKKNDQLVDTGKHVFKMPLVHDTLSALLYMRGQKLEKGEAHKLVAHPDRNGYLVTIVSHGKEIYEGQECIKVETSLLKINRDTHVLKDYDKLNQKASIWFSADKDRLPVAFKAKLNIGKFKLGSITAKLTAKQKP